MYKAKKHFGQNFLHDQNIINNILKYFNPSKLDLILEIGPGLGALTYKLAELTDILYLVEVDKDLAKKLENNLSNNKNNNTKKIILYNQDILKFDLNNISNQISNNKIKIIGNLPYNISTPILFHLFNQIVYIKDMLFMLQLEVVERMVAKPNTKQYGRLSVMTQFYCHAEKLFNVPNNCFKPAPKVESAIVSLKPKDFKLTYKNYNINSNFIELLNKIVASSFNQRRKTISNSLKEYLSNNDFEQLNLGPKLRAENLNLNNYLDITNYLISNS